MLRSIALRARGRRICGMAARCMLGSFRLGGVGLGTSIEIPRAAIVRLEFGICWVGSRQQL